MSPLIARGQHSRGTFFCNKILITLGFWSGIKVTDASQELMSHAMETSGGQSTQIKYLSKSTDTYTKILLQ